MDKKLPCLAALILATAFIVGCGEDGGKDNRLSDADIWYIKQQRIQAMYGGGTQTTTSTQVSYVTITNVTTVSP
jgi:hypothetical protein